MKEEIDNIIRQMHTDMGYPFMCVQEEEIPVAVNRLHKAFIQAQLDTLKDIDKMYHSQDKAHSLRLYIDHLTKLLEDE